MHKRIYRRLAFEPVRVSVTNTLLATSVIDNSIISSVGQEVGVDESLSDSDFTNNNWETGF